MTDTMFELADKLKAAKERKKELDAETKTNNALIEELDQQLSAVMAEQEVPKFSRNGSLFYLSSRLYASPKEGMRQDMIAALRANGYGDLVTETVNANTLSSFVKERIAESEVGDMPQWLDSVVSTFEKVSVGVRKG